MHSVKRSGKVTTALFLWQKCLEFCSKKPFTILSAHMHALFTYSFNFDPSLWWGAYWAGHWIQAYWLPGKDIAWKELFAIAFAVNTWGHHWPRKKFLVHCDNQAVVDIWKKGTADHPQIMALVHMLYFFAIRHNIHVIIAHIDGTANCIADALSRFQVQRFHKLAPKAAKTPDTIRAWLIQLSRDS